MPVQISGVLKDGTGKPVPGCTIEVTGSFKPSGLFPLALQK
ncbi:prophage tail fiber N-terminal domain-containing protein [Escherichia coli]|nr:prophage tail fiber N-terminal domain-containing protein [Escherichia coli]UXK27440.1 prophage tail fiber N-terminal domain-containing protein [Escherichia coli]